MAEEAVIEAPETGPEAPEVAPASPEPQAIEPEGPQHQPDGGVDPKLLEGEVPSEPNNVDKVQTDGKLTNSIDGKIPEGLTTKSEWLHTLLQKEKDDPGTDYNEDELDILDEYYEGRLKPDKPQPKEESKKDPDTEDSDDAGESNNEDDSIESVLKEVGAKNQKELLKKVKDLRKVVSGKVKGSSEYKDMQSQVTNITQRFQSEMNLMEDVKAGIPEAIQHLEQAYGIKVQGQKTEQPKVKAKEPETIDDDSDDDYLDDVAGRQIKSLKGLVGDLTEKVKSLTGQNDKVQEKFAGERAEGLIIDEMVEVADKHPLLREIKNLRGAVKEWRSGKNDPRLEGFNDLFKVANKHGVDLITADEILAGRNASFNLQKAKLEGKKEAYSQKPNRSLSDLQGRGTNNKPSYSEEQVMDMIDNNTIPSEWYDKDDQPNMQTIPRQYLKHFFHASEIK